jgi:hypothetical protein
MVLLRNAIQSLSQTVILERFATLIYNTDSGSGYNENTPNSIFLRLNLKIMNQLFQVGINSAVLLSGKSSFLLKFLVLADFSTLSDTVIKVIKIIQCERHVKNRFPKLSSEEFLLLGEGETCPVCLEEHKLKDTIKLSCGHLVHSSCMLSMVRMAANGVSQGEDPSSSYNAAHRCPVSTYLCLYLYILPYTYVRMFHICVYGT